VDKLWPQMAIFAQGRVAARFAALIAITNPFANWSIDDRYEDGTTIDAARAADHLVAARKVVGLLQQARIDGFLS
jgi:hypothetical protein